MATWNGICAASSDDARETAGANTIADASIILSSGSHWLGARFAGCPVAPGDAVTSATLTLNITTTVRDSPDGAVVRCYDGADMPALTTTLGQISGLATTTANTPWSGTNIGTGDHNIDVTAAFSEFVSNGSYVTGNAAGVIVDAASGTDVSLQAWDGSSSLCPRLTVVYTPAAGGGQPMAARNRFVPGVGRAHGQQGW